MEICLFVDTIFFMKTLFRFFLLKYLKIGYNNFDKKKNLTEHKTNFST